MLFRSPEHGPVEQARAMLGRQVDGPVAKLPHRLRVEIELVHAFPP